MGYPQERDAKSLHVAKTKNQRLEELGREVKIIEIKRLEF